MADTNMPLGVENSGLVSADEWNELAPYADKFHYDSYSWRDVLMPWHLDARTRDYISKLKDYKNSQEELASARAYENSAIQRQVADAKAAGINPYWVSSALSGAGSTSNQPRAVNGSSAKDQGADEKDLVKKILALLAVFGLMK